MILQDTVEVTVGENIITTTKIRNNYGAIQSFQFSILRIAKLDFSLLPLVKLSLLILFASMNQSTKLIQKLKQRD